MDAKKPSAARLRALLALHAEASHGEWRIDHGGFGGMGMLWITTWWRERGIGRKDSDGPICSVSTKRTVYREGAYKGERASYDVEIKTAKADAELIVAAVNELPGLIAVALGSKQVDETAWLIEYPADKYGPVRYLAIGEQPVISASDATRFCREEDAQKYMRAHAVSGARPTEHAWTGIDPAQAVKVRRALATKEPTNV